MQEFIQRIKQEFDDLSDKVKALRSFIGSEKFNSVSVDEQSLMKLQLRQMEPYLETLKRRLEFYSVQPTEEEVDASLDSEDDDSEVTEQ